MKSLKLKMLSKIIPLTLFLIGATSIVSYLFAKNVIVNLSYRLLDQTVATYNTEITSWLNANLEVISNTKLTVENTNLQPDAELNYLETILFRQMIHWHQLLHLQDNPISTPAITPIPLDPSADHTSKQ